MDAQKTIAQRIATRRLAYPIGDASRLRALGTAVATYSNQEWTPKKPLLSASLPDGSRIQLVMPPAVEENCYSMTLRKPAKKDRTITDFAAQGLFKKISD